MVSGQTHTVRPAFIPRSATIPSPTRDSFTIQTTPVTARPLPFPPPAPSHTQPTRPSIWRPYAPIVYERAVIHRASPPSGRRTDAPRVRRKRAARHRRDGLLGRTRRHLCCIVNVDKSQAPADGSQAGYRRRWTDHRRVTGAGGRIAGSLQAPVDGWRGSQNRMASVTQILSEMFLQLLRQKKNTHTKTHHTNHSEKFPFILVRIYIFPRKPYWSPN